ncbi:hypothetical protein SDC9_18726 [bioreactor metagenome]|uniref:Uncharacterized protein n=2 Tax=root TaxID=1 RepID=Q24UD4_DESHY|nr:hypothetical protein DSY2569 [Desulfitobacterium hafniense Y51]
MTYTPYLLVLNNNYSIVVAIHKYTVRYSTNPSHFLYFSIMFQKLLFALYNPQLVLYDYLESNLERDAQLIRRVDKLDNGQFQELVIQQLSTLTKSIDTLAINQEVMQADINTMKADITDMKTDISNLKQSQVRMEEDLTRKITALFDSRELQKDVNQNVSRSLERIEAKIDILQIETAYLKRIK